MPDVRCEQVPGHMLLAFWEAVAGMVGRLGSISQLAPLHIVTIADFADRVLNLLRA